MRKCPDCKNEFVQPFVCTTCGSQKLYDTTVVTLQNQLAAAQAQRDKALAFLHRYRNETPLGNQPHMIAHDVDLLLKECGK